jgi:hypothetical protein
MQERVTLVEQQVSKRLLVVQDTLNQELLMVTI